ncbi:MAG TPA: hypothetical protein VKU41_15340 [Polyangiaceae bacterium]|nr:hypothetical protein [Polyangiaceae bacterium]
MRSLLSKYLLLGGVFLACGALLDCSLSEAGLESPDGGAGADGGTPVEATSPPGKSPPDRTDADLIGADGGAGGPMLNDGAATVDATSADGGTLAEATVPDAGPPDTGPCNGPCLVTPNGWTPVAFLPMPSSTTAACPAGFGPATAFVESPSAGAGACTCGGCNVIQPPSCDAPIDVHYDNSSSSGAGTCSVMASAGTTPLHVTDGGCGTDLFPGSYAGFDLKYTLPAATGGTCTADGKPTGSGVTYGAHSLGCLPEGNACDAGACPIPAPFKACIMTAGEAACPAGPMTDRHLVGTGAAVSCSTCTTCTLSAGCTGTVSLYPDGACKQKMPYAVVADGHCDPIYQQNQTYKSYTFAPAPPTNVTCQASGSTAQGVSLASEATVCCAP